MSTQAPFTKSRFYVPCLEVLKKADKPLGVGEIIQRAIENDETQKASMANSGGVRSHLLLMGAKTDSHIKQVEGSQPPLFFYSQDTLAATPKTALTSKKESRNAKTQKSSEAPFVIPGPAGNGISRSMFYDPCCAILKACAPEKMTACQLTSAIIEKYPELEWSHSNGPVRAMLLKASSKKHSPIQCVKESQPPLFFYDKSNNGSNVAPPPKSDMEIMDEAYTKTRATLKKELLEKVKRLDPLSFEHLANRLVAKMLGGVAEDTPLSRDGGIDGYIHMYSDPLGLHEVGIQAKHYVAGQNVQSPDIQRFKGALNGKNGVFVTCADYAPNARKEAEKITLNKIVLVNGQELVEYMIKYQVGVREKGITYSLKEVDESFFDSLA